MTDLLDKETMVALDEILMTLIVDSVEYKISTMPSNCFTCYSICEGDCMGGCVGSCEGDCEFGCFDACTGACNYNCSNSSES